MEVTTERIVAIAPDAAALATARKLAASNAWKATGASPRAAWGECQGSALYQVRAALGDLSTKCSCPSRKFPCKHGLALLLLAAEGRLRDDAEPDWVAEWLTKRTETQAKRAEKQAAPDRPPDPAASAKRAAKRHERVLAGLDALDLWMDDLVRGGFASIPRQRPSVFEQQAARLVDAQAPGLASRLRRIDAEHGTTAATDEAAAARLLAALGRLALLTHAYRRVDSLDPALAADVRQAVGFTVELGDVAATGERVVDDWAVLGSWTDDDERVRVQRTWLRGLGSGRDALIVQFAAAGGGFGETYLAGTRLAAELAFWPGAWPLRALVRGERGDPSPLDVRVAGHATLGEFLGAFAGAVAKQPWLDRAACCLHDVLPGATPEPTWAADRDGRRVDFRGPPQWRLLALSGGAPVDVLGEWDADALALRPLLFRVGVGVGFVEAEAAR